ncbi:hypothetical protein PRIPAC_77737, partial [Pristionchus pacificus]|uniref:Uncharacterized protein n=1 Tax=Pristionchus pacificus TaxID=54126 RepID=A0A2A6C348_PRIPA
MAVERFTASRNSTNYESSRESKKFVVLHIALTILGAFTQSFVYDFPTRVPHVSFSEKLTPHHCTAVSVLGRDIQTLVTAALFSSELFTIYFYTRLLRQKQTNSTGAITKTLAENTNYARTYEFFDCCFQFFHTSITMAGAMCFFYFELASYRKIINSSDDYGNLSIVLNGLFVGLIDDVFGGGDDLFRGERRRENTSAEDEWKEDKERGRWMERGAEEESHYPSFSMFNSGMHMHQIKLSTVGFVGEKRRERNLLSLRITSLEKNKYSLTTQRYKEG